MTVDQMVEAVKAHAKANYSKAGWDYVVECYSWQDIADLVMFCNTAEDAIMEVLKDIEPYAELRDEVRAA